MASGEPDRLVISYGECWPFLGRIEDSRGVIEGMKAHIGDLSTQVTKYMVHVELSILVIKLK